MATMASAASAKQTRRFAWPRLGLTCAMLVGVQGAAAVRGDETEAPSFEAVRPISGSLVIAGGGVLPPEIVQRFLELGGGKNARLVVVTSASSYAGTEEMDSRMGFWREQKLASLDVMHTRSPDEANDPAFYAPLETATAVWFIGGNQNWITDSYRGTKTEEQFHAVLERGGVIGGTSAGAAIMSRVMIAGGREHNLLLGTGFGFAPGLIVDQHFRKRNRQARLIEALNQFPGRVGVGIDESTALVIRGSKAEVIGTSDVTITLGASPGRPAKLESLQPGKPTDLAVLSRAAHSRLPQYAVARPQPRKGMLILVGQGDVPDAVRLQFLDAAGGKDAAIVVVGAGGSADGEEQISGWLKSGGASNVTTLRARSRHDVESPEFLAQIGRAQGIWLSNGPIRNLIDTYVDSPAHRLLEKLLEQGGVVAGSAAGAELASSALSTPLEADELEVTAEAYERGLGFLPCVAVKDGDPHAEPSAPLAGLKARYPHLIGVELKPSTALVVRGTTMRVIGKHPVTIVDRQPKDPDDYPEFSLVQPGESYDLTERKRSLVSADVADQ